MIQKYFDDADWLWVAFVVIWAVTTITIVLLAC